MQSWFIDSSRDPATALASTYDPVLVIASIVIACLAGYAALSIAGRIATTERTKARVWWLLVGAFTMGTGVWTMHFIAMLAFNLPVLVKYDVLITFLSTLPAIFGSGVMLAHQSKYRQETTSAGRWGVDGRRYRCDALHRHPPPAR